MSYRKMLLIVAALAGAITFAPSSASAQRGRGRRGWGWGGPAIGLGIGLGLAGAGYYGAYGYPAHRGCWRRAVVETPYGPRVRRIWVCN
jgi:hypothetical protein